MKLPISPPSLAWLSTSAAWASFALLATGCSSDDDGGGSGGSGEVGPPVTTYYAFQRSNGIASVRRGNSAYTSSFQIINEAEGGMALDFLGNLYQADLILDDLGMIEGGAVRVMTQASERSLASGQGSFNELFDRTIEGFSTTLMEPRSVALAHGAGLLFVTDSADSAVKVFGTSAGGDAAPLYTAIMPAPPWDLAYHEAVDRLYVSLADGSVAVLDDFVANEPAAPTGSIVPSLDGSTPLATDLRGIAVIPTDTAVRLVVSDFGLEAGGTDGVIYVFDDVTVASGLTAPDQRLRGATAGLRNPIDLDVGEAGFLRVVDAGSRELLVFPPAPNSGGGLRFAASPSLSVDELSPLAVLTEPVSPARAFAPATDLDAPAAPVTELLAVVAPAGMNSEIQRIPADLSGPATAAFDPGLAVGGIGVDVLGDVYATFTQSAGAGPEGGVRVLNRLALARGVGMDLAFDPSRDRLLEIEGNPFFPVPKPVAPTAIDVDERAGIVVMSDPARPGIWTFGMNAGPSASEWSVVDSGLVTGGTEPGQLDYDAVGDRLFVAVSSGTAYVYDRFATMPGDAPDRTITPGDSVGATQVSESIRGLVHDAALDLLFLSDVGAASGSGNDGSIYVIDGARLSSGLTPPIATISGAATGLDDPVSLAWDGSSLWVADSANGTISRFDNFLTLDGNVAPTATLAVADVISIVLRAEGLAPTSGGSISSE